LNSTEIQSFELDDWHMLAPVHSNLILLPPLFAAAGQKKASTRAKLDGKSLLLSTIVGYETGPRVGLYLYGGHMLTVWWHSGTTFGHAAAAAAVSRVDLQVGAIENALGMACTQACGLMSAQFGNDVKRMQHGFAARNGLFAALMAESGYIGIKNVFEEPCGGFLSTFGQNSGKGPPYLVDKLTEDLGEVWQSGNIRVKSHASMAGTHCTIDTVSQLQI
jgi:aconitate decarboxylase